MPHSLYDEIPDSFFVPLASKHRRHYSQLLMIYYDLFETYSTGVEREVVVSAYENHLTTEFDSLAETETEPLLDDGITLVQSGTGQTMRSLASDFLRKLINYGWMTEEVLADYTQIINITMWARPFYLAIAETLKGLKVEYESHIIGIHSSLCSDTALEHGHHAVLNALDHTRKLIESLKTLSQNIKVHIEMMFNEKSEVRDILHIHYDLYMHEVVDRAYTRLKTSDNLSKYRPVINKAIANFLLNTIWMEKSAHRLSIIRNCTKDEGRNLLSKMLLEIRDDLRNIDPMLEEIDDKNRQYSRISTEKIKAHLYADSSIQGKVKCIIQGLQECEEANTLMRMNLSNISWLAKTSLYARKINKAVDILLAKQDMEDPNIEAMETEMRLRIEKQLSPEKIRTFLDEKCHTDGSSTPAEELVDTMEDFVRILYATAYAEGREKSFPYRVRWGTGMVQKDRFEFKEHSFLPVNRESWMKAPTKRSLTNHGV
jgi:hypothetical protein